MLQIAVCEDKKADREYLVGMLESLLSRYVSNYQITSFSSGGGYFRILILSSIWSFWILGWEKKAAWK